MHTGLSYRDDNHTKINDLSGSLNNQSIGSKTWSNNHKSFTCTCLFWYLELTCNATTDWCGHHQAQNTRKGQEGKSKSKKN